MSAQDIIKIVNKFDKNQRKALFYFMLSKNFEFKQFKDGCRINLDLLKPEVLAIIYKAVELIDESESTEYSFSKTEI
jgi:hypothetical protein